VTIEEFKSKLFKAADKLRSNMDASEYKYPILGLIFLKYVSDAFTSHRDMLAKRMSDPNDEMYEADESVRLEILEDRDEYTAENVFWVPESARWEFLRQYAKSADIAKKLDDAMREIESENHKLKGILYKEFSRLDSISDKIGQLIDLFSTIGFDDSHRISTDSFGLVFEYFLGNFASSEGKRGGQFYTPPSCVNVLTEILAPYKGRLYDGACGSAGMFVSSEKFILAHNGKKSDISLYGQESNPTTWKLAAMNLAIRGFDFNLGNEPGDTFSNDQHPNLKADYVLANPPFNVKDWSGDKLTKDKRWVYGIPPEGNANYAWLQHFLSKLSDTGRAGIVLANGSMTSNTNNEGVIRKAMIDDNVVECMVALPGQLFTNTQIPACIWFLAKKKPEHCRNEILFIDMRNLGSMATRIQKEFSNDDIQKAAQTYHNWAESHLKNGEYEDIAGFCKSVGLDEVKKHDYVLTPGRYVGAVEVEDDGVVFSKKMEKLTAKLAEQFAESRRLEDEIQKNLAGLGYELD
jgi:type I restriction enzyme M protein